jgi:hypothetical protein
MRKGRWFLELKDRRCSDSMAEIWQKPMKKWCLYHQTCEFHQQKWGFNHETWWSDVI